MSFLPTITALTNFIVPLIQGDATTLGIGTDTHPIAGDQLRSADAAVRPGAGLTIEGRDLLMALKRFAGSLVHSPNGKQIDQQSLGNLDQTQDVVNSDSSGDVQPVEGWDAHMTEVDAERQQQIEKAINSARDTVFNKMPIRLLMFDENGQGIKLVERSDLMECISSDLNSVTDFNNPNQYPYNRHAIITNSRVRYHHTFEKYAILSHTWLPRDEVTYSEWRNHIGPLNTQSPGYNKLEKFCEVAAGYSLRLAWMDTVCINKESSSELDESIRSMFKWYKDAEVCIVYLAETTSLDNMKEDRWFTRGWTLQELLAPNCIKFFSKSWTALSNISANESDKLKDSLLISKICDATGLDEEELSDSPNFYHIPIWRKMQWAADRKVTREEDTAYSLMGIFNVSMPTGYGEGADYAFLRLIREILSSKLTYGSGPVSQLQIANWNLGHGKTYHSYYDFSVSSSALIPRSPYAYRHSNSNVDFYSPSFPITLSHMGLCIPVLLMPSTGKVEKCLNSPFFPKGDYSATVDIGDNIYNLLDGALFSRERSSHNVFTFAVLNIAEKTNEVLLPENGLCLAIMLWSEIKLEGWEIPEDLPLEIDIFDKHPFTFNIIYHNSSSFKIPKDELNRHGMTLRTMHL